MPQTMYSHEEIEMIIRVAYAGGVRDTLVTMQGGGLTDDQESALRPFITEESRLSLMAQDVLRVAIAHVALAQTRQRRRKQHDTDDLHHRA